MGTRKIYVIAGIVLAGFGNTLWAQDVNEILTKHEKAIGGMDNWNKVKNIKWKGVLNTQGAEVRATNIVVPGKEMTFDTDFGGTINHQVVIRNKDQAVFITWPAKEDSINMDAMNASWPQFNIRANQLLGFKEEGTKTEYMGEEAINNAPCYKIKCTSKTGFEFTCFIDKTSYYLVRTESLINSNDEDKEVSVGYSDYKEAGGGIMLPMSMATSHGEMVFSKTELNVPVTDSTFKAAPPETK